MMGERDIDTLCDGLNQLPIFRDQWVDSDVYVEKKRKSLGYQIKLVYEGLSTLPATKGSKAPNGVEVCLANP